MYISDNRFKFWEECLRSVLISFLFSFFKFSQTRETDTHKKGEIFEKLQFFKVIKFTVTYKLAKLVFCKLVSFSDERWFDRI